MLQTYPLREAQARLVLGNRPTPPSMTGLRYISTEEPPVGMELVSVPSYYSKVEYPSVEPIE